MFGFSYHAQRILQACHLHHTANQMQAPSNEHLTLSSLPNDFDGVLDGGHDMDLVFGVGRVDLCPGVGERVLRCKGGEVVRVNRVGRQV